MTLFHLFQKLDRTMRNRPDAHRWRVTMSDTRVEIFRRPVLTSAVTLGALGIGNAPMPVPVCVCYAVEQPTTPNQVDIYDHQQHLTFSTTTHAAYHHMTSMVDAFVAQLAPEHP